MSAPATVSGRSAPVHRCPLCGGRFAEEEHCSICPMTSYCHTLCCPNCGYSFVERSSVIDFSRRVVAGIRSLLRPRTSGGYNG